MLPALKLPFAVEDDTEVIVGAVASTGVALSDAAEGLEVPPPPVAVEVNVYATPFVNPVTVHDPDDAETVHDLVAPATEGDAVTVYEVGDPPVVGATTVTVTCPSPAETVGWPGAPGAAGKYLQVAIHEAIPLVAPSTSLK